MNFAELKNGLKQYIETRESPQLLFIGGFVLIAIFLTPHDVVEKVLAKSGFTVVYILICCIVVWLGNLGKKED